MLDQKTNPEEQQKELAITKVTKFLDSDIVKARFSEVVGDRNTGSYISSVMISALV